MRVGKPNRVTEQITEYARLAGGSIDLPSELTELCPPRREGVGIRYRWGSHDDLVEIRTSNSLVDPPAVQLILE